MKNNRLSQSFVDLLFIDLENLHTQKEQPPLLDLRHFSTSWYIILYGDHFYLTCYMSRTHSKAVLECPPEYTKKPLVTFFFKLSLQIYIIVIRNKKNLHFSLFFALKTDNSFFCHGDIPTIHNGYCVSNAVNNAKKTMFYQRFRQLN